MSSSLAGELVDVSKRYGSRWAVRQVTVQVPKGQGIVLTGHNGSGKTTLLKILATLTTPSLGRLTLLGQATTGPLDSLRRRIALVSHAHGLYEDLSATDNVALVARALGLHDWRERVRAALERLGLGDRQDHAVRTFSAGMRKRVALARALVKQPELLLLDEPFAELDSSAVALTRELVREHLSRGGTVIISTHQADYGPETISTRWHMDSGRLKVETSR